MSQSAHPVHHTFDDYVRFERTSNVKHDNRGPVVGGFQALPTPLEPVW